MNPTLRNKSENDVLLINSRIQHVDAVRYIFVSELKNIYLLLNEDERSEFDLYMNTVATQGAGLIFSPTALEFIVGGLKSEVILKVLLHLRSTLEFNYDSVEHSVVKFLAGAIDTLSLDLQLSNENSLIEQNLRASIFIARDDIDELFLTNSFLRIPPLLVYTGAWINFYATVRLAQDAEKLIAAVSVE